MGTDRGPTTERTAGPGRAERVALVGDLDLATADAVSRQLDDSARHGRPLAVDASGLDFVDCHGLGVLLRAQARWPGLRVVAPSPSVLTALHLTGRWALLAEEEPLPPR